MKKKVLMIKERSASISDIREKWKQACLSPLWERDEPAEKKLNRSTPTLWSWSKVKPLIQEAINVVSPKDVERRVLSFNNPAWQKTGDQFDRSAMPTFSTALQVLMPGESARPHRHSMGALRFIVDGNGAITTTDGKKCRMEEGDLILTPSWRWHEHYHGGSVPIIWMDVLDSPLHRYLGTDEFEPGPIRDMPNLIDDSVFANSGIVPVCEDLETSHSLMFRYPYEQVREALKNAPLSRDGTRKIRYVNPFTGGSVLEMLDCYMVSLEPDQDTMYSVTNSNSICHIVEGTGFTEIGDNKIYWKPHDIFTVPQNNKVRHYSDECATLFMVSDRQIYKKLGLLKEQILEHDNRGLHRDYNA